MSVLLTAGKSSVRKLRKSDKHNDKEGSCSQSKSVISYLPSDSTAVWNCVVDGETLSIAIRKDTLDIWCNDNFVESEEEHCDEDTIMSFELLDHKGCIVVTDTPKGLHFLLTLDGKKVPQTAYHEASHGKGAEGGTGDLETFSTV